MAAVPQKRRALAGCVAVRVSRIPGRVNTVYVKDQQKKKKKKKTFFIASGNRGSALRLLLQNRLLFQVICPGSL